MAQLMPLPLTISCSSKIQIGFTFLVPAHLGIPGKRAVKLVCVWLMVNVIMWYLVEKWKHWMSIIIVCSRADHYVLSCDIPAASRLSRWPLSIVLWALCCCQTVTFITFLCLCFSAWHQISSKMNCDDLHVSYNYCTLHCFIIFLIYHIATSTVALFPFFLTC